MRTLFCLLFIQFTFAATAQDQPKPDRKTFSSTDPLYDQDLLSKEFHRQRREELRRLMPDNSAAVFFSSPVRNRSNDVDYEYHQDPNFYYLTGLREPNAVVVIYKYKNKVGEEMTDEIIFVQGKNPNDEVWTGRRLGMEGVRSALGFEIVHQNKSFADFDLLFHKMDKIFILPQHNDARDDKNDRGDLHSLLKHFNSMTDTLGSRVNKYKLTEMMAMLREIKTPEEIALMRKAIDITCEAQMELIKSIKPGMTEYQTEAIVEYIFHHHGAEHEGFPSIQGGGENSCVLHYQTNRKILEGSDLLVSDIGAEYHGYTADVTRTIPVDGKFSADEATIYNLVLKAQEAGIKACRSGNKFWDPNAAAVSVITKGLLELGIIKKADDYKKYFIHGTSHYLGLDVHDPGMYGLLKPNMVITVEPGIYIPAGSDCDERWWNIGVRIEDDILITNGDPDNLSDCIPRTIEEIERLIAQSAKFFRE